MASGLNVFQQVYQLSMASNIVRACKGSPGELQDKIADALPGVFEQHVGPGWEVVWGPAVWKHDGATDEMPPDNVWYVAKNDSVTFEDGTVSCAYVVAIAATAGDDFENDHDWQVENFGVTRAVNFTKWVEEGITTPPTAVYPIFLPGVYTAKGTTGAVYGLANFPPVGSTQPLCEFLQNVDCPPGSNIIFAGQSLGGALSPTLALTLKKAGCLDKFSDSLVYPSAGASPGNAKFAELFREQFPVRGDASTYQVWNVNLVNMLDVVPNAWSLNPASDLNLGRVLTLYGELPLNLRNLVAIYVAALKAKPAASMINYVPLDHATFTGPPPAQPPQNKEAFFIEFAKQHMHAYHAYVLGPNPVIPDMLCETSLERDIALSTPILGCLEDALKGRIHVEPEDATGENGVPHWQE